MRDTRRSLLLLPVAALARRQENMPSPEPSRFNTFANAWNVYVLGVEGGVQDVRLWHKVVAAWGALTK